MSKQDIANHVCRRLIDFAYEIEDLDRVLQTTPEGYIPRADILEVLHDAVMRAGEDITKLLD